MNPKVCRDLVIASAVFGVLGLSYMSTSMNSGEWIRSSGNQVKATPFPGGLVPGFKGVLSQGLWNKCTAVNKQGPVQENFACCSNLQSQDFINKGSFTKLETTQTLALASAASTAFGILLLFIALGTKKQGVKIAATVFVGLGAVLAISTLSVYADYWKNSRMIKQQPVHYVMGWGQSLYIAATVFSVVAVILVGISLRHVDGEGVSKGEDAN